MNTYSESHRGGAKPRSAAQRDPATAASAQRRADSVLHQLAALARPSHSAAAGSGVVQRAIRVGPGGAYHWYTELDDVLVAARKAGIDLGPVHAVIVAWLADGSTHGFDDWTQLLVAAGGAPPPPAAAAAASEPLGSSGRGPGAGAFPLSHGGEPPRRGPALPMLHLSASPAGSYSSLSLGAGAPSPTSSPREFGGHGPAAAAAAFGTRSRSPSPRSPRPEQKSSGGRSAHSHSPGGSGPAAPAGSTGSQSDEEGWSEHDEGSDYEEESTASASADGSGAAPASARPRGYEAEQARLRAQLERQAKASAGGAGGPAGAAGGGLKLRSSTINFSSSMLAAGAALHVSADTLQSRKPHKKTSTGGGGGGTDHQGADGKAALRASKIVKAKIREKTGADVKPADYLKGLERAGAAAAARSEKSQDHARKALEAIESTAEDRLDWLAHLASPEWRALQSSRGNDVRAAPNNKKKIKALTAMATANGWPTTWNDSFGPQLYSK